MLSSSLVIIRFVGARMTRSGVLRLPVRVGALRQPEPPPAARANTGGVGGDSGGSSLRHFRPEIGPRSGEVVIRLKTN